MSKLSLSLSHYWLILIFAVPLIIFGCQDGTVNGPQNREPYEEPEPDPISLSVSGTCADSTGIISGSVTNYTDSTKYMVKDSTGSVVAQGTVESDGSIPDTEVMNGSYDVVAKDGNRQAKSGLTIDCFQKPVGPGNFRRVSEECYQVSGGWQYQGKFTVQATRGWDRIKLVNVTTGQTLIDEEGITPENDQTRTFDDLTDGRYKATAYKGGEPASVEYVAACDKGPGEITLEQSCNTDTGVADFTITVENGFESFDINRDGNDVDSGDGLTPESGQQLSYEDVANGDYSSTFTRSGIENSKDFSISCEKDLTPPNAEFSYQADKLTVDFDGSDSNDPDGSIESYEWEFGDGSSGSGVSTTHEYDSGGTYSVTLTVTDNDGLTDTATKDVTVQEPKPPVARFDFTTDKLTVDFDGSDSNDPDGSIESYEWEFGDGASGSGVRPTHKYSSVGTYSVTLTVTDDQGLTDAVTKDVAVDAKAKLCGCIYNLPKSEDYLVDSNSKFFREPLFTDNILPVEPYSDWVNIRVDARFGGQFGDQGQPNEGFGLKLKGSSTSAVYTDVAEDPYDGITETWIYQDIEVDADKIPVDENVSLTAVHQADPEYGMPGNNGYNSVFFKDVSSSKSNVQTLDGSDPDNRGSYVKVTFEVAPGEECPPRYSPE